MTSTLPDSNLITCQLRSGHVMPRAGRFLEDSCSEIPALRFLGHLFILYLVNSSILHGDRAVIWLTFCDG